MMPVRPVVNRYHTAVAAAHPAPHRPLDRDLRAPPKFPGDARDGFEHRFRSAGVNHDVRDPGSGIRDPGFAVLEFAFERSGDAGAIAGRSIFGREHEPDASGLEPIEIKEFRPRAPSIKQRRCRAARQERFAEGGKWGEPDTACNHPRFCRWIDHFVWTSKRPETGDGVAPDGVVQNCRRDADALAEQRQSLHAVVRSKHFEYRERPVQQGAWQWYGLYHAETR